MQLGQHQSSEPRTFLTDRLSENVGQYLLLKSTSHSPSDHEYLKWKHSIDLTTVPAPTKLSLELDDSAVQLTNRDDAIRLRPTKLTLLTYIRGSKYRNRKIVGHGSDDVDVVGTTDVGPVFHVPTRTLTVTLPADKYRIRLRIVNRTDFFIWGVVSLQCQTSRFERPVVPSDSTCTVHYIMPINVIAGYNHRNSHQQNVYRKSVALKDHLAVYHYSKCMQGVVSIVNVLPLFLCYSSYSTGLLLTEVSCCSSQDSPHALQMAIVENSSRVIKTQRLTETQLC